MRNPPEWNWGPCQRSCYTFDPKENLKKGCSSIKLMVLSFMALGINQTLIPPKNIVSFVIGTVVHTQGTKSNFVSSDQLRKKNAISQKTPKSERFSTAQ